MRCISLFIVIFCLTSCEPINKYFGLKDDNVIEELSEMVLKKETGIDVDLTPSDAE